MISCNLQIFIYFKYLILISSYKNGLSSKRWIILMFANVVNKFRHCFELHFVNPEFLKNILWEFVHKLHNILPLIFLILKHDKFLQEIIQLKRPSAQEFDNIIVKSQQIHGFRGLFHLIISLIPIILILTLYYHILFLSLTSHLDFLPYFLRFNINFFIF